MNQELEAQSQSETKENEVVAAVKPNKWKKVLSEQAAETQKDNNEVLEDSVAEIQENSTTNDMINAEQYGKLKKELTDAQEALQYLRADLQNERRILQKEIENARRYSASSTIEAYIPLIDSLESSLEQAKTVEQFQEGTKRLLELMESINTKVGIKVIDPKIGDQFDPNIHSAISTEKVLDNEFAHNAITKIYQKGYQLHARILRPAMVVVSELENKSVDLEDAEHTQ